MDKYTFNRLKDLDKLTDDDKKILQHLTAIDNLFKKGDCKMSHIFAQSFLMACVRIDGEEYAFDSFIHIRSDGGDPDDELRTERELLVKLDELENDY